MSALLLTLALCQTAGNDIDARIRAFYWSTAVADVALTWHAIERHGARELNPIVRNLETDELVVAGVAIKIIAWFIIKKLYEKQPKLAKRLAIGFGIVQLGAVVHNHKEVH